jgi:hypothetical protein
MTALIMKQDNDSITLQVTIPFNRSMLDSETAIQDAINNIGKVATGELLKTFDTEGEDIVFGAVKMTSKGLTNKCYQTPYGEIEIERHIYQAAIGGTTFCPLEREARIILTSTPRFASQISHKMSEMAAPQAKKDLEMNHHRKVSLNLIQRLAGAVSAIVQIKEESWSYHVPEVKDSVIKTIGIGLDGTCMLMCEGGYRQAMVGTIALYDSDGERQHTTYLAATPEYGKEKFKERLIREIERTKEFYPSAIRIGIADGAHDNWEFLEKYTHKQTLDFYHASEYLTDVADRVFTDQVKRKAWLDDRCHQLKHTQNAAVSIQAEMEVFLKYQIIDPPFTPLILTSNQDSRDLTALQKAYSYEPIVPSQLADVNDTKDNSAVEKKKKNQGKKKKSLETAITYFRNNNENSRMNYWESVAANHVIGSGITEAACKTIVKQRLCKSGMRWKDKGAAVILSLRTLAHSSGRWEQFWKKVNQYGFPIAA